MQEISKSLGQNLDARPGEVLLVGFAEKERAMLEAIFGTLPKPPLVEAVNQDLFRTFLDDKALQRKLKEGLPIVPSIVVRRSPDLFERLRALQPNTAVLVGGDSLDLELGPLKSKPRHILKRPVTAGSLLSLLMEAQSRSAEPSQVSESWDKNIPRVTSHQEATPEIIGLLRGLYQSLDLEKAYQGALYGLRKLTKAEAGAVLEHVRGEQGWRVWCHDGLDPEGVTALRAWIRQAGGSISIQEPLLDQNVPIGRFTYLSLYPVPMMDEGLVLVILISESHLGGPSPWIYEDVLRALQNSWIFASIQAKSFADPITGVFNRRFLEIELPRELYRAKRHQRRVSLLFAEADGMADLTKNQGEDAANRILKDMAKRLSHENGCIRNVDLLIKYGTYSFLIILIESDYQSTIKVVAPRVLRVVMEKPFLEAEGLNIALTASVGVANFPMTSWDWKLLLAAGEKALKEGQRAGGNVIVMAKESSA